MYMTGYNIPSYFVKVFKNKYGVLPKDFMKRIIELCNPQKITCIIFENLFGPYFLPHQSHSCGYCPVRLPSAARCKRPPDVWLTAHDLLRVKI